jgi:SAM-dependent methyltransferase
VADPAPGTPVVAAPDGVVFYDLPVPCRRITEVPDYRFTDLRYGDTVLDIGANIGAFAIRAARLSPAVTAVEPVTFDLLAANIRLNAARVRAIRGALGNGTALPVRWDGMTAVVRTEPLRRLIGRAGGCDFLKCDCEGAEWLIDPRDLDGVRRIEMELHLPPIGGPPRPALLEYIGRHYSFTIDRVPCHGPLGLLGFLHAERID